MFPSAQQPPREGLLAEGASSQIYLSRDNVGRPAALKLSRSERWDASLLAEARAAAQYRHPSLLPVLEHGVAEDGRIWLLLPLLTGSTLSDWRPPLTDLLDALTGVADALDLLHHGGVGHADLKPGNLLLDDRSGPPRLLLADLGLLSPLGEVAPGGTPAYLSPRRLDGQPLTWRDDLHSFAVLLFEALAGELPWSAKVGDALLQSIRAGRLDSLQSRRPELSGEIDAYLAETLCGDRAGRGVMGWLDGLRAQLGIAPHPRCLFLRDVPLGGEEGSIGNRTDLVRWLQANLYSVTSDSVTPGHEELRTLEVLGQGSPQRMRSVLETLLREQELKDHSGLAVFAHGPAVARSVVSEALALRGTAPVVGDAEVSSVLACLPVPASRALLREWLGDFDMQVNALLERGVSAGELTSVDEVRIQGVGRMASRDFSASVPPLPSALFAELWGNSKGQHASRIRIVALAAATASSRILDGLGQAELLDLIERAPGEDCDELLELLRSMSGSVRGRILTGLLTIVRRVRTDQLDAAVEAYWDVEPLLTLDVSAALNKLLFYQLSESGRLQEASEFLRRWSRHRGKECSGTVIEIQMAAREVSILAAYGAFDEAREKLAGYEDRFEGRRGRWILHMAQTNLAEAVGDRRERIAQSELALAGLEREGGAERMRLDLILSICGAIILCSDADQWGRIPDMLQQAEGLASESEVLLFQQRIDVLHAQMALFRGDFAEAERRYLRAKRDAERSGELSRAQYIEGGLTIVQKERGEGYDALRRLDAISSDRHAAESLRETLDGQDELADVCILVGDLERAAAIIEAGLPAAEETGRGFSIGIFRGLRGRLRHLLGDPAAAAPDLRAAVEQLQAAHALRDRNQYLLELIDADSMEDRDGARVAAIIEHEEAVSERRLLPKAWLLESRRLRRAGAVRDAALALQQAFEVAATLENPEHRWPLHLEAAELALEAGAVEAAREDLERALDILRDLSLQYPAGPLRERFLARPDRRLVLVRLRALDV
ncbi:MAG: protein kinase [Candidatus Latescibacteria bacterium]|nr:protein kinase [Candidatus Latescibacterota bacterium]